MPETASLVLKVKSDSVTKGRNALGQFEKSAKGADTATGKLNKSSLVLNKAMIGVGVAVAGVSVFIGKATRNWLEYDKAIKEVRSISGLAKADFASTRVEVLKLSAALGVDATEAAQGLYQTLSAGVSKKNSLEFLETSAKLAVAGVTDVKSSVDLLTTVINGFGFEASEAERVSDQLFKTVELGKTTIEELASSMATASVPAAAMGIEFEELLASVISLTKQGVPTAEAFTQVKSVIQALINPSDELKEEFTAMGVESGRAAIAQKGFIGTLDILRRAVGDNDALLFQLVRRSEALNGVLALTGNKLDDTTDALNGVRGASGSTASAYATNADTMGTATTKLKTSFVLMVEKFEKSFGVLEKTAKLLGAIADEISRGGFFALPELQGGVSIPSGAVTDPEFQKELVVRKQLLTLRREQSRLMKDDSELSRQALGDVNRAITEQRANFKALNKESQIRISHAIELDHIRRQNLSPEAENKAVIAANAINKLERERLGVVRAQEAATTKAAAERDAQRKKDIANAQAANDISAKHGITAIQQLEEQRRILQQHVDTKGQASDQDRQALQSLDERIQKLRETASTKSGGGATGASSGLTIGGIDPETQGVIDSLFTEEEAILASYQRRREIVLNSTELTEQEKTDLMVRLTQDRENQLAFISRDRQQATLSATADFFGGISALAATQGKKGAKIAKTAAIAQATIKTYESATSAFSAMAGIPYVGPALGAVAAAGAVAAGLANIAAIKAQPVGNYASGGIIPGSSFNGDNLTANVNSGEMIINRQQQAALFNVANRGGGSGGGNVTIINQTRAPVDAETVNNGGTMQVIIREAVDQAKSELTDEINNGSGSFSPMLQNTFALQRGL